MDKLIEIQKNRLLTKILLNFQQEKGDKKIFLKSKIKELQEDENEHWENNGVVEAKACEYTRLELQKLLT